MAIGDEAQAAGYPILASTDQEKVGWQEINRTRDFVAEVKNTVLSIWPLSKGGTGSGTAGGARTNLGISTGTASPSDAVGGNVNGNIYFQIIG